PRRSERVHVGRSGLPRALLALGGRRTRDRERTAAHRQHPSKTGRASRRAVPEHRWTPPRHHGLRRRWQRPRQRSRRKRCSARSDRPQPRAIRERVDAKRWDELRPPRVEAGVGVRRSAERRAHRGGHGAEKKNSPRRTRSEKKNPPRRTRSGEEEFTAV